MTSPTLKSHRQNAKQSTRLLEKQTDMEWKIFRAIDERTGEALVGVEYDNPIHGRQYSVFNVDCAASPEKLRTALLKVGAEFQGSKNQQIEFLTRLLNCEAQTYTIPKCPGFRDEGFVMGNLMLGTALGRYRYPSQPGTSQMGIQKGTFAEWNKRVGATLQKSSFGSVAVMAALAAPLPGYAETMIRRTGKGSPLVSETMTLNFSGTSGSGRTTISMAAASCIGPSTALSNMDFTRPGLEHLLEQANDHPLFLDDTEKCIEDGISLKTALRLVNQYVPSRKSRTLAQSARDKNPPREWSTIGVMSSPLPIEAIAASHRWSRSKGERARLINIPVPDPDQGGLFDGVSRDKDPVAASSVLAKLLEQGMTHNYGYLFPEWIKLLLSVNLIPKIESRIELFVSRVAKGRDAYQVRLARKFGLLYAAGRLATDRGLISWSKGWPLMAVTKAYKLACRDIFAEENGALARLKTLHELLEAGSRFPKADSPKSPVTYRPDSLGIRCRIKGVAVCGIRDQDLERFAGSRAVALKMLALLATAGAVYGKQGHASTMQLPYSIKLPGGDVMRPRFRVIRLKKLKRLVG